MFKEIMQNSGLAGFAEVGLVIFLVTFVLIVVRAFFGMSQDEERNVSHLPLDMEDER